MTLIKAKVIKRDTADGTSFLFDEVPIGHVYYVDPCSIRDMKWYSLVTRKFVVRQSICVYGSGLAVPRNTVGMMPTELLEIGDQA